MLDKRDKLQKTMELAAVLNAQTGNITTTEQWPEGDLGSLNICDMYASLIHKRLQKLLEKTLNGSE